MARGAPLPDRPISREFRRLSDLLRFVAPYRLRVVGGDHDVVVVAVGLEGKVVHALGARRDRGLGHAPRHAKVLVHEPDAVQLHDAPHGRALGQVLDAALLALLVEELGGGHAVLELDLRTYDVFVSLCEKCKCNTHHARTLNLVTGGYWPGVAESLTSLR